MTGVDILALIYLLSPGPAIEWGFSFGAFAALILIGITVLVIYAIASCAQEFSRLAAEKRDHPNEKRPSPWGTFAFVIPWGFLIGFYWVLFHL